MKKFFFALAVLGLFSGGNVLALAEEEQKPVQNSTQTEETTSSDTEKPVEQVKNSEQKSEQNTDQTQKNEEGISMLSATTTPQTPVAEIPKNSLNSLKGLEGNFDTDLFTGSASYSYPLWVPSVPSGNAPSLSLSYSSSLSRMVSDVGYGWTLPTNAIFRNATKGIDKMYDTENFATQFLGNYAELIKISDTEFAAKVEENFVRFKKTSALEWEVKTGDGTVLTFGGADGVQKNPENAAQIYKWMLKKQKDRFGNVVEYSYFSDSGNIFLQNIWYGKNENVAGSTHHYSVSFLYSENPKKMTTYSTGFKVESSKILSKVEIREHFLEKPSDLVATYELSYGEIGNAFLSLSEISRFGKNGEAVPPVKFAYYDGGEIANGQKIGLLKTIFPPLGGQIEIAYTPSTAYRTKENGVANARLPFVMHTVSKVSRSAGPFSPVHTTEYAYANGHYFFDPQDAYTREYAGFGLVVEKNPLGEVLQRSFYQSQFSENPKEIADHISKKGKIWKIAIFDATGKKIQENTTLWGSKIPLTLTPTLSQKEREQWRQIFLEQEISQIFVGETSLSTAKIFSYDDFLRSTQTVEMGEVVRNGLINFSDKNSADNRISTTEYATDATKFLLSFPSKTLLKNASGTIWGETQLFYDALPFGKISKGNVSESKVRVDAKNFRSQKFLFNAFGNVIKNVDGKGNESLFVWDSTGIFLKEIENALHHKTQFEYDTGFGIPIKETNGNGIQQAVVLDGLGRIVQEKIPMPETGELFPVRNYIYDLSHFPSSVYTETALGHSNLGISERAYFDGLGRPLQYSKEMEGGFSASSVVYDALGRVKKEIFPKKLTTNAFVLPDEKDVGKEYFFDALGRTTQTKTPMGSEKTVYGLWSNTLVDANGQQKIVSFNVWGNVIGVKERILDENKKSIWISSIYSIDFLGNVVQMKNAENHIQKFSFNLLSEKLSEELLHGEKSASAGFWTWEYDENGNVKKTTDPNGNRTEVEFDALNRPVKEKVFAFPVSDTNPNNLSTVFRYDTAENGIGKIFSITSKNAETLLAYDKLGNVKREEKILMLPELKNSAGKNVNIAGLNTLHKTQFSHDLLGNILEMQYPSGEKISYRYNTAGQLEGSFSCFGGESCFPQSLVWGAKYNEMGLLERLEMANGVVEENFYDRNKNFLLTNKKLSKGGKNLQTFSYTFDGVGNIGKIVATNEKGKLETSIFSYDTLHRLTKTTIDGVVVEEMIYSPTGNVVWSKRTGNYSYSVLHPQAVSFVSSGMQGSETTLDYDRAGNMTKKISAGKSQNFSYDAKMRLSSISPLPLGEGKGEGKNGGMQNFYDHSRNRVAKFSSENGNSTLYVNEYLDIENGFFKPYVFFGGKKLASLSAFFPTETATFSALSVENFPNVCTAPTQGNWEIFSSCVLASSATVEGNVVVHSPAVLTISSGNELAVNLQKFFVKVEKGAGILVKNGGKLGGGKMQWSNEEAETLAENAVVGMGNTENLTLKTSEAVSFSGLHLDFVPEKTEEKTGEKTEEKLLSVEGQTTASTAVSTKEVIENGNFDFSKWHATSTVPSEILAGFLKDFETSDKVKGKVKNSKIAKFPNAKTPSPQTGGEGRGEGVNLQTTPKTVSVVIAPKTTQNIASTATSVLPAPQGIAPQTTETNELLPKTTAPAGTVFHFSDHLGSSSIDTDSNGNVIEKTEYFPFGETRAENGNFQNPYKYTGKELDEESGMYYYKARYYDPLLKRFASVDPITLTKDRILDPQSLNYFAYVRNNPMKFVDPSGENLSYFLSNELNFLDTNYGTSTYKQAETTTKSLDTMYSNGPYGIVDGMVGGLLPNPKLNDSPLSPAIYQGANNVGEAASLLVGGEIGIGKQAAKTVGGEVKQLLLPAPKLPKTGDSVFRIYGGKSNASGASWTPNNPQNLLNPRNELGLPNVNTGKFLQEAKIENPNGIIQIRPAKPLDGNKGGATEWIIPDPYKSIKPIGSPKNVKY